MVELVFGILFVVLVGGLMGLAYWVKRGEGRPDVPGVRTIATFAGGDCFVTDEERAASPDDDVPVVFGEGLIEALAKALNERGVRADEIDGDAKSWHVLVEAEGARGFVQIGRSSDADAWTLGVLDPPTGGPGPRSVVVAVAAALVSLGLSNVRWHRRLRLYQFDEADATVNPTA